MSRKNIIAIAIALVVALFIYNSFGKKESAGTSSDSQAPAHPPKASWNKYSAPSGHFEVLFPVAPQHVSEVTTLPNDNKTVKYDIYLAQEKDGSTFMISEIQYPASFDAANQDVVLEGVMKEMVAGNPTNVLVKSAKGQFHNFPSLDFSIKNSDFSVESKAMLSDKILYVFTVMDRDPNFIEDDFGTFVGSFSLKNEKK